MKCFNPRARMGRDTSRLRKKHSNLVSIHAPAWGATHENILIFSNGTFQSTRPHGARLNINSLLIKASIVSIHAPAWGATIQRRVKVRKVCCFNPRARMGRDVNHAGSNYNASSFNPRARMGRDCRRCGLQKVEHVSIHAPAWGATGG